MSEAQLLKAVKGLFIISILIMFVLYSRGYDNSINWEVTTTADIIEYPALTFDGQLLDFEIKGEKYVLSESYSGSRIQRNYTAEMLLVAFAWLGISIAMVSASFLPRYGFLFALGLFTLFLNRLNLFDVGLFGIHHRLVVGIPFIGLLGPLFFFHEYRPETSFLWRVLTFLIASIVIAAFGISSSALFLDHFIGHSNFTLAIAGMLFLFVVAEENVFAVLYLVSRGKGGKQNHLHFFILTLVYLLNLILYYLDKSGYVPNGFHVFDPYLLLILSSFVAIWSLSFKTSYLSKYMPGLTFQWIVLSLGIVLFTMLGHSFFRGNDGFFESFHYFILYFHIGFGVFFFFYIIFNFIDPLIQGLEVYKIVYKEQHFPYVSARLGGFVVVLGFYFLSNQESYRLLRAAYYSDLGTLEETKGNYEIGNEYFEQAAFLGYNTHYSNYQLAWNYSDKGNEYLTKVHFESAATRFPSPYAYLNYTNLDIEINPVKVQAILDEAAATFPDGEIRNNQGVLRVKNKLWEDAYGFFEAASASDTWNQAPLLNKWATSVYLQNQDSSQVLTDWEQGNYGVRANLLVANADVDNLQFVHQNLPEAPVLHRQAYLVNAASKTDHDSLSAFALREITGSIDANFNDRMRKELVFHYYRKGEINKAFRMLDYLQSNDYEYRKGGYFNALGILALDQGAYRLSLSFFDRASELNYLPAEVNRLEALAYLGRSSEIPDALLSTVKKDPGLTALANTIISNSKTFKPQTKELPTYGELSSLSDDELVFLLGKNAFDEQLLLEGIPMLNDKDPVAAYNIILEATEINPYAVELLQLYAIIALEQNLETYARAILPQIEGLSDEQSFGAFMQRFNKKAEELSEEVW